MTKPVANSKRPEKRAAIDEISSVVQDSSYCFLLNYGSLTVASFSDLRAKLRSAQSTAKVVKNSYLAKAFAAKGWTLPDDFLVGPTAVVTGSGDPAEVAKLLVEFLKKNDKASAKGANLEGSVLSADDVDALSKLPSKDVMRATLLATFMAPASSLVRVFAAPLTGVLYVLKAKAEKDGGGADAPAEA